MKKLYKTLLTPLMLLAISGCSAIGSDSIKGDYEFADDMSYVSGGDVISPEAPGGEDGEDEPNEEPEEKPTAGQLTCSALDDNKEYDFWKSLTTYQSDQSKGVFQEYKDEFAFNTFNRIGLTINNGKNISVKVKDDDFATYVDNLHQAYLFPQSVKETYEAEISFLDNNNEKQTITKEVRDGDVIDLENTFEISNYLQIMFVIDATGSMGDEMEYIKSEINDVITRVKNANEAVNISLAMMVYRDEGDDYVTKYSDFTDDISKQQEFLSKQQAKGGGDFEEAVQVALNEAIDKQWSTNATKLLFHVADAPAHDKDVPSWNDSVIKAAQKGIKIITVASSGIDKKTEYFFRSQSILTSGQYVFLTDDSGIGGGHLPATTKEKLVVEYLNECLIRLINGYYSGEFAEPVSYHQSQQHLDE